MFGTGELIVILLVALILFGGKKLPEFARSLGVGIREFKKACQGIDEDEVIKPNKETTTAKKDPASVVIEIEPEHKDR